MPWCPWSKAGDGGEGGDDVAVEYREGEDQVAEAGESGAEAEAEAEAGEGGEGGGGGEAEAQEAEGEEVLRLERDLSQPGASSARPGSAQRTL